jgi:hypothetical protein
MDVELGKAIDDAVNTWATGCLVHDLLGAKHKETILGVDMWELKGLLHKRIGQVLESGKEETNGG